jgi:hypothetical protein
VTRISDAEPRIRYPRKLANWQDVPAFSPVQFHEKHQTVIHFHPENILPLIANFDIIRMP